MLHAPVSKVSSVHVLISIIAEYYVLLVLYSYFMFHFNFSSLFCHVLFLLLIYYHNDTSTLVNHAKITYCKCVSLTHK